MSTLVETLCTGTHAVEVWLEPAKTLAALRTMVENNRIHIKFPNTEGGTELGISLDPKVTNVDSEALATGTGLLPIVGSLVLDYVAVRCVAEIDVETFRGVGRLEKVSGVNLSTTCSQSS